VDRRAALSGMAAGLTAFALPALAQQQRRVRRIGFLAGGTAAGNASHVAAFRLGMTELRWLEGRDYTIDTRYAENVSQAAADLAAELVATQPDLLLTTGDSSIRALAYATKTGWSI
jgi:putative ABC transport system substrate-binding protein